MLSLRPKIMESHSTEREFSASVRVAEVVAGGTILVQGAKNYEGSLGDLSCCRV